MKGSFSDLQLILNRYLDEEEISKIQKAYIYAKAEHGPQIRKSGEPYITHPVSVAAILAELHLSPNVIIAALLHDVVEDTPVTIEEITEKFGEDIALIVSGVTKLGAIKGYTIDQMQAENHRRILIYAAKDIRVLLVKLADRLHNMQTISFMNVAKQKIIANETLEVYAPIAHRLGMYKIKWELEDLSFKCLNRAEYDQIAEKIRLKRDDREKMVENIINDVELMLSATDINFKISGRSKHIYSIYKKIRDKNLEFEELTDLFAFRVVVDTIPECYSVLGLIHENYKPIPKRFKDYIPTPKHNLYQSIHTTIITEMGIPMEFQIRTIEMDQTAEYGVAAHWMYKSDDVHTELQELANYKLTWLNEAVSNETYNEDSKSFMSTIKNDVFAKSLIVYTPVGDVIELPENSTVLDFAFYIHTDVGLHALSAKVNDKIVSLFYRLEIGDVVSVVTSPHSKPTIDWVARVKTNRARESLKHFFKDDQKRNIRKEGRHLLIDYAQLNKLTDVKKILDSDQIYDVMRHFKMTSKKEFYYEIGSGELDFVDVVNFLKEEQMQHYQQRIIKDILIDGVLQDVNYTLCTKCSPIPGDKIKADEAINHDTGEIEYMIHRLDGSSSPQYLKANWTEKPKEKYKLRLLIEMKDEISAMASFVTQISQLNFYISSIYARGNIGNHGLCRITILVNSVDDYESIKKKLLENDFITKVQRRVD
ncbi:MAG: RelA/SpoT family protein [Mycoplasmatales bacterium]